MYSQTSSDKIDLVTCQDFDKDGVAEVAVITSRGVQVRSGSKGLLIWSSEGYTRMYGS